MRAVALIEAPAAAWRGRTSASTRGARARGPRPSFASSDVGETSETFSSDDLVQVGAVVGAHSLRGEVRVKPMTDFVEERFMTTEPRCAWSSHLKGNRPRVENSTHPLVRFER